jgi:hypothetical protein
MMHRYSKRQPHIESDKISDWLILEVSKFQYDKRPFSKHPTFEHTEQTPTNIQDTPKLKCEHHIDGMEVANWCCLHDTVNASSRLITNK